jgi:hypothetical protein
LNAGEVRSALLRAAVGEVAGPVPSADDWSTWLWRARFERGIALLARLVELAQPELPDEALDDLRQYQASAMARCLRLEHHMLRVTRQFATAGVGSVVLKGGATSHLDYADPSHREFSDIDLLIHPAHRELACQVLAAAGWEQGYALPTGHERYYHAITFVLDGMELDLHQRISHRALGLRIRVDELLDRQQQFHIAGSSVSSLHPVDRLIHSAVHAATSTDPRNRKLCSTADVLVHVRSLEARAAEVLAQAEHWRVRPLVQHGITETFRQAQLELPRSWPAAIREPIRSRDRLLDRAYGDAVRHPVLEELAYLRVMPNWRDRWGQVSGYLRTNDLYVRQHHRSSGWAQLRYLARKTLFRR